MLHCKSRGPGHSLQARLQDLQRISGSRRVQRYTVLPGAHLDRGAGTFIAECALAVFCELHTRAGCLVFLTCVRIASLPYPPLSLASLPLGRGSC